MLSNAIIAGARVAVNPGANSRVFGGKEVLPADILSGSVSPPHEFQVHHSNGSSQKGLHMPFNCRVALSLLGHLLLVFMCNFSAPVVA